MLEGRYLFFDDDKMEAFEIRKQVMTVEGAISNENNVNTIKHIENDKIENVKNGYDLELDELEEEAIHVLVNTGNKSVATGRLIFNGRDFTISKVAVVKEERGNGYGDFTVRMLLDKAFSMGAKVVRTSIGIQNVGFYQKIGFQLVNESYENNLEDLREMKISKEYLCKNCNKYGKC